MGTPFCAFPRFFRSSWCSWCCGSMMALTMLFFFGAEWPQWPIRSWNSQRRKCADPTPAAQESASDVVVIAAVFCRRCRSRRSRHLQSDGFPFPQVGGMCPFPLRCRRSRPAGGEWCHVIDRFFPPPSVAYSATGHRKEKWCLLKLISSSSSRFSRLCLLIWSA